MPGIRQLSEATVRMCPLAQVRETAIGRLVQLLGGLEEVIGMTVDAPIPDNKLGVNNCAIHEANVSRSFANKEPFGLL